MVLKGQRFPSGAILEAVARDLKLNPTRKRYLELLVLRDKQEKSPSKKGLEATLFELDDLNPKFAKLILDDQKFAPIADWFNLVIKQLVETPGFEEKADWIVKRLRGKVKVEEVRQAIEKMVRAGVLGRDGIGQLIVPSNPPVGTTKDLPSVAIRRHHAQMMQRAVESLVEQDVSNRQFGSATLRFDAERMSEAKQAIRDFQDSFAKKFSSDKSRRVYQLSLQFFEHTAD
jgi:uncharacterized protein (TIGR02147 family)